MIPTWFRRDGIVQSTYDRPLRIHAAQIYPIRSPNGSTVIIYGHEKGLSVLWRGGRCFKQSPPNASGTGSKAPASASQDLVMVIDSDDEEPAQSTQQDDVQPGLDDFEDSVEEYDPSRPYENIIDAYDITQLDTSVLHIAVPLNDSSVGGLSTESRPSILAQQIVVVTACADSTIRLLTLPLMPMRQTNAQRAQQYTIAEAKPSILSIPRGVGATWTSQTSGASGWTLIVASHSAEAGGLLSVFECPLAGDGSHFVKRSIRNTQQEYIRNVSTCISFSSARLTSRRHTQLLLADSKGCIRIYDPLPHDSLHSSRATHNSNTEAAHGRGTWLATLYAPFERAKSAATSASSAAARARILDAKWALDGKCIIVLLADGQWGVWDIEGIAPSGSSSPQHGRGDTTDRPSPAGSISHLALRAFVGDSVDARSAGFALDDGNGSGATAMPTIKDSNSLAPMTPRTRKARQERLFSGLTKTSAQPTMVRGGISLASSPSTSSGGGPDESVVFWHGTSIFTLPSLMAYWQRVVSSSMRTQDTVTMFGPSITQQNAFSASGELITGVSQPPQAPQTRTSSRSSLATSGNTIQHDVLVSAEHRLIVLCPAKTLQERAASGPDSDSQAHKRAAAELGEDDMMRLDQDLLSRGDLDIGGLDRILDGLGAGDANGGGAGLGAGPRNGLFEPSRRRVGFVGGV